ncbi:MAG: hypothetical protein U0174_04775 [Polyangiaceae bacterium]
MKKILGLTAVIGTIGLALACTTTVSGGGSDSGTGDTDSGTVVDSGTKPDTGKPPVDSSTSCYEEDKAGWYKHGEPKLNQNKATTQDLTDFFNACFKGGSTQQSCEAYTGTKAAPLHTDVVNCVFPFYNPALDQATFEALPASVWTPAGESGIVLNMGTCRALAVNAPAGCALKYTQATECLRGACDSCEDDTGFGKCIDEAEAGGCKTILPEAACDSAVTGGAAQADALCGKVADIDYQDDAKLLAAYLKIGNAFCGKTGDQ